MKVLLPSILALLFLADARVARTELLAEWTFSEGTGHQTGSSISGHPLELTNGPEGSPPEWDIQAGFKETNGMIFRRENRSLLSYKGELPEELKLDSSYTIEAIFKLTSLPEKNDFFSIIATFMGNTGVMGNGGVLYNLNIATEDSGTFVRLTYHNLQNEAVGVLGGPPLEVGRWIYAAVTFDPGKPNAPMTIYVGMNPGEGSTEGLQSKSRYQKVPRKDFPSAKMNVGALWFGDRYFDGNLGIIRLHSNALAPQEIEANYSSVPQFQY